MTISPILEYTILNMEAEKRKLIKFSNYSLCITLPKWIVRKLNWQAGEDINVFVDEKAQRIIVSKKSKPGTQENSADLRW